MRFYDIDTGSNAFEDEFGGHGVSSPGSPREGNDDFQVDKRYLPGTCMISKIAGWQFGVAKKPKLTIVKVTASFMEVLMLVWVNIQSLSVTKGWTPITRLITPKAQYVAFWTNNDG